MPNQRTTRQKNRAAPFPTNPEEVKKLRNKKRKSIETSYGDEMANMELDSDFVANVSSTENVSDLRSIIIHQEKLISKLSEFAPDSEDEEEADSDSEIPPLPSADQIRSDLPPDVGRARFSAKEVKHLTHLAEYVHKSGKGFNIDQLQNYCVKYNSKFLKVVDRDWDTISNKVRSLTNKVDYEYRRREIAKKIAATKEK